MNVFALVLGQVGLVGWGGVLEGWTWSWDRSLRLDLEVGLVEVVRAYACVDLE